MIGKLIFWGQDREEAIFRMQRALQEIVITGVHTNIDFNLEIFANERFIKNDINTSFIQDELMRSIS